MSLNMYDIQAAIHSIKVSDGTNDLLIDGSGHLSINDGGNSLTVDGTVAATQSGVWNIGTLTGITNDVNIADGGNSITVDAVDLDIRDLTSASDSVEIKTAAGQALTIDGSGFITANINGTVAATQSGVWNIGTLTSITNDVSIDDGGNSITIDDGGGSITVDGSVSTLPGGYASWKAVRSTVSSAGESELASTPLAGRLAIMIQNLSNIDIYLKEATGVTTANGMLLPKRGVYEADLDDGANVFAIADSGTTNQICVVEYAA